MSDYDLPDLPSDEELGIAGLSDDDLIDDPDEGVAKGAGDDVPPSAPPPPPRASSRPATPPAPERPAPAWRGVLTLLILLLAAWASRPDRTLPAPRAANAPDSVFSSARALTELVDIARVAHPPGSPEHARVRDRLIERLRGLGLDPQVQTTTVLRENSDAAGGAGSASGLGNTAASGATVRNIVARVAGTASTGAVVLTAHYDSRTVSPGAGDDGAGVVTILETLRALQAGPPLKNDLIVLISDAEELGLLGARAFVDKHPWMADVRLVISVEMRGAGGPSIMFETNDDNGWIVERLAAADPDPLATSLSGEVYERLPNDTDFTPFRRAGVQGLNFAAVGRAHVYHQAYDTPANLQESTLQHHGVQVLAMVRDFGAQDLTTVDAPSRAFLTLPVVGLLTWPRSWALPLSAGLGALLLLTGVMVVVRGGGWRGMLAGAGLSLLAVALTAAAGQALFVWARGRHPEFGALAAAAFHVEGWYVAAVGAMALAVTSVGLSALRGRVERRALFFGAMLPVVVLAIVAGFVAPDAAAHLQGPAAAGLLVVLALALVGARHEGGWLAWGLALVFALPVLGFLVLVVELVWIAMSFALAAVIGGAIVVTLLLMAPAVDALGIPNRWWLPLTSLAACALFVFLGARTATPSPERPAPSTLVYVQDQGGPGAPVRALWVSRPDAGVDWAREATTTALEGEETFDGLRLGGGSWLVADAPAVTLPPPRAIVTGDTVVDRQRRLTLSVDPGLDAEGVGFRVEPPAKITRFQDAVPGEESGGVQSIWNEGRPLNDSTFDMTIVQDAGLSTLDLEILQHHQRPWELVGGDRWARPADLAPNIMNRSDRAVIRSRLRLLLDGSQPSVETDTTTASVRPDTTAVGALPPDTGAVAASAFRSRGGDRRR